MYTVFLECGMIFDKFRINKYAMQNESRKNENHDGEIEIWDNSEIF